MEHMSDTYNNLFLKITEMRLFEDIDGNIETDIEENVD
jgi:hypothetical protein